MIIEIRGLPEGQKIKHIDVSISFDEIGNVQKIEHSVDPEINTSKEVLKKLVEEPVKLGLTATRAHKDVPTEMTDVEF